jgi:hypothetical protein
MVHHRAMGIRWYGWAVTSDEAERARSDPWPVIRVADDRHDIPGWTDAYFDKAWRPMQCLFADPYREGAFKPRPAYSLVAGDVTYIETGEYSAHVGLVSAEQVRAISNDLEAVTRADVRAFCGHWFPDESDRASMEERYVFQFLEEAKEFTADAASRGHWVIYVIR